MKKQKISKLMIGTNNKGKLREIKDLLPKKIKIFSTLDFRIKSPKETGKTFRQNSILKAKYFSKKTNLICLSDDSGLEISVLKNQPGIYSSRWAGKNNNFNVAIKKVFNSLNKIDHNWKTKKIKARFVCDLSVYWPKGKLRSARGVVYGHISKSKKGSNGFGYDPIFIPKKSNKTFGQINPKIKNKIDHRFMAFKKIKKFL